MHVVSCFVRTIGKDISNVVVQCRQYSKKSCHGLCLNYFKKLLKSKHIVFLNNPYGVAELLQILTCFKSDSSNYVA